jgi:hypothetical protein
MTTGIEKRIRPMTTGIEKRIRPMTTGLEKTYKTNDNWHRKKRIRPMTTGIEKPYGWIGQQSSSGFINLAPSILHYNWF